MNIARSAARIGCLFGRMPGVLPALHAATVGSLVALAAFAPSAQAVVVISPASNIAVPLTTTGIYINVVSGVSSASPAAAPGWDINLWSATNLSFFNPTAPTGGVYV